jgi:hypothetical protein
MCALGLCTASQSIGIESPKALEERSLITRRRAPFNGDDTELTSSLSFLMDDQIFEATSCEA